MSNTCGNKVVKELFAPDKTYKAIIFERNCGATTGFSTQISVVKANEDLFNESGNVFVAETDDPKYSSKEFFGGPKVEVNWIDSKSLSIEYNREIDTIKIANNIDNIQIIYSTTK